ncbi:hypothetical protein [Burkholderia phage FLC9]|nr:hypothetical protein [Burkholderia phage FLC9]
MIPVFTEHWYVLLFLLVWGHFLADFPLQGPYLSEAKNPNSEAGKDGWWVYCMFAHVTIHAGFVYLFTGSFRCAFVELIGHSLVDHAKCEGWLTHKQDQRIHLCMKVFYVLMVFIQVS